MVREKSRKNTSRNGNTPQNTDKSWLESSIAVPTQTKVDEKERAVKELALYVDQRIEAGLHLMGARRSDPKVSKKRPPQKHCYYHHEMPGTSQDAIDEDAAIEHQLAEDESEKLERQTAMRQLENLESEVDLERDSRELLGEKKEGR